MYYLIFIIGLIIGSFLNVCIYRIPLNQSIAFPPSQCTKCGHKLKPYELIPVLSYIFLKGKCKKCKTRISFQYPLVELLTAVSFCFVFYKTPFLFEAFILCGLLAVLIVITFIDSYHQIIPDELVIIGGFLGVVFLVVVKEPSVKQAIFGVLIGGGTLYAIALLGKLIFMKEAMGGGDIKLMAMMGLFLGIKGMILALLLGFYSGGLYAVIMLITKQKQRTESFAFGPFLVLGCIVSLFYVTEIVNWYLLML